MRYAAINAPQWLFATVLIVTAGACNSENQCQIHDDCYRGEACIEGTCQVPEPNNIPADFNNTENNTTKKPGDPPGPNVTTTPNNTNGPNSTNRTTSGPNNTTPNTTNTITGECRVDPFTAMCPPDDNDSFSEYLRMEDGRGCASGNTPDVGAEYTFTDHVLCPLEDVDIFSTNLLPCDQLTFFLEVTVTPHQDCDPDDWDLTMSLQGNTCDEPNGMMRCELLADGSRRITAYVSPSFSIASPNIRVHRLAENLRLDYDIKLHTRL